MTKISKARLLRRVLHPSSLFLGVIAAAILLLGAPHAQAQAIDEIVRTGTGHINDSAAMIFNTICWVGGGALFIIAGFGWYRHSTGPNAGMSWGRIGTAVAVGSFLVMMPFMVRTATFTWFGTGASVDGTQQMMRFDK